MRSEVARGRSVLISSHLLDDLADLTNSFYFIEAGTLVEKIESSSQTLKQEYLDTYEGGDGARDGQGYGDWWCGWDGVVHEHHRRRGDSSMEVNWCRRCWPPGAPNMVANQQVVLWSFQAGWVVGGCVMWTAMAVVEMGDFEQTNR